jgi:hypothetical protein
VIGKVKKAAEGWARAERAGRTEAPPCDEISRFTRMPEATEREFFEKLDLLNPITETLPSSIDYIYGGSWSKNLYSDFRRMYGAWAGSVSSMMCPVR